MQKTYAVTRMFADRRQYLAPGPTDPETANWTRDKKSAARLSALRFASNVAISVGGRVTKLEQPTRRRRRTTEPKGLATKVSFTSEAVYFDTIERLNGAWADRDHDAFTRALGNGLRRGAEVA